MTWRDKTLLQSCAQKCRSRTVCSPRIEILPVMKNLRQVYKCQEYGLLKIVGFNKRIGFSASCLLFYVTVQMWKLLKVLERQLHNTVLLAELSEAGDKNPICTALYCRFVIVPPLPLRMFDASMYKQNHFLRSTHTTDLPVILGLVQAHQRKCSHYDLGVLNCTEGVNVTYGAGNRGAPETASGYVYAVWRRIYENDMENTTSHNIYAIPGKHLQCSKD